MTTSVALLVLLIAALLEAGGDAIVRSGLHAPNSGARLGLIALGGIVLTIYGLTVNAPSWDFGRLLGVYVALFFTVAQAINWLTFGVAPSPAILLGGTLIIAGGLVMTLWR